MTAWSCDPGPQMPMHIHSSNSVLSMVVPIYNAELAPKSLRGRLVSLNQLAITAGIMVHSYPISLFCPHSHSLSPLSPSFHYSLTSLSFSLTSLLFSPLSFPHSRPVSLLHLCVATFWLAGEWHLVFSVSLGLY